MSRVYVFKPNRKLQDGTTRPTDNWYYRFPNPLWPEQCPKNVVKSAYTGYNDTLAEGRKHLERLEHQKAGTAPPEPVAAGPAGDSTVEHYLTLYAQHMRNEGDDGAWIVITVQRIRYIAAGLKARLIFGLMDPASVKHWLAEQRTKPRERLGPAKNPNPLPPMSAGTFNRYVQALQSFLNYLADYDYIRGNPLRRKLRKETSKAGERKRRTLHGSDFTRLIHTTAASKERIHWHSGPDRAMLYLFARQTGIRAAAIASLTPEHFDRHARVVQLDASFAKNKSSSVKPLGAEFWSRFEPWLDARPAGKSLWPGRWYKHASKMIMRDLATAKIPYKTPFGVYDFHSLRRQFGTDLARAGVPLQQAQKLMDHCTPVLTANIYTDVEQEERRELVARLDVPDPRPPLTIHVPESQAG